MSPQPETEPGKISSDAGSRMPAMQISTSRSAFEGEVALYDNDDDAVAPEPSPTVWSRGRGRDDNEEPEPAEPDAAMGAEQAEEGGKQHIMTVPRKRLDKPRWHSPGIAPRSGLCSAKMRQTLKL